jgi:hypothetical protein
MVTDDLSRLIRKDVCVCGGLEYVKFSICIINMLV